MEEQKLLKRKSKALLDNNQTLLLNTCTDLANLYMVDGRYEKAITEYSTIAEIYKEQNKIIDYARACRGIGEAYMGLQKYDKGLEYQFIFLDLAKEQKNKIEEQRALATIGHTYLTKYLQDSNSTEKEDLNSAKKYLMKSLIVCESLSHNISKLEHADMSARLFSNLGLVEESLGNQDKALELIRKSINICKTHDIYEQLQRGYMSLASLLEKQDEFNSAIHNYNLAIEITKKLDNKASLMPIVLSAKADVLIKLGDIKGAKSVLRKAYKLQTGNSSENNAIERNLKIVTLMSNNEDKLLTIDQTNYTELKKLYEEMGDAACYLKCYPKAIDYYKKMLEILEKSDKTNDRDLIACYYSLAETYKDNNQLIEAINYYEKEYELNKHIFKDGLDSLCRIADTKELANCPINEIQSIYNQALESCRKEGNRHEEGRILRRFILYLKRQNEYIKAAELEELFNKLNYISSEESESEPESDDIKPIIGDNISLNDITDESNESDDDDSNTRKRRRPKTFIVKRNLKGETQLHTACINGKLNVVHHLLEQNHPVNVRDNCGWLPLHEACICGHLEIVELLIEKGAAINDRGGTHCNGVTPIYDAASNGHLEIVQLLLSKGASAIVKTDDGETVLDILKKWRESIESQLSDSEEQLYQSLIERISKALEAVGHSKTTDKSPKFSNRNENYNPNRNRKALIDLDKPSTSSSFYGNSSQNKFTDDYRNVIENLRHNKPKTVSQKVISQKRSALIESNDAIDDDWLEDDLSKTVKKRRTGYSDSFITTSDKRSVNTSRNKVGLRRTKSFSRKSSDSSIRSNNENRTFNISDEDEDFDSDSNSIKTYSSSRRNSIENQINSDLLFINNSEFNSRHSNHNSPINLNSPLKRRSFDTKNPSKKQLKLTDFGHTLMEADSTTTQLLSMKTTNKNLLSTRKPPEMPAMRKSFEQLDPTLSVDVKINDRLYRVPVLLSQINTHTIKWLAEEAATRYARKEYIKPTLELETKEGAVLANDDLINLLFPMGANSIQTEQLTARVIKWNLPPLSKRYQDACIDMNLKPNDKICNITEQVSTILDLNNMALRDNIISPLFKALNRQINLLELDISGNYLTTDNIILLRNSLVSLQNLIKLNLSCTGLSTEHIHSLTEIFNNSNNENNLLENLSYLDISDNFIGDQSFRDLSLLTRHLKLKFLNLSSNKLSKNLFEISYNKNLNLFLDFVEDFDLSQNELNVNQIKLFVSWLNLSVLKSLNLSRNLVSECLVKCLFEVFNNKENCLEVLNLSRCEVQDSELFDLLGLTSNLKILDLSYNNKLTGISLRRLLQNQTLNQIKLYGCDNIIKYFENCSENDFDIISTKQLKISLDPITNRQEIESLTNSWRRNYGSQVLVETIENFTSLSVS